MKKFVATCVMACAMLPGLALAETCADTKMIGARLEQRFGETLLGAAPMDGQAVLEVYAAPRAETWTIMVNLPQRGLSCLVASGRGMQQLEASGYATNIQL